MSSNEGDHARVVPLRLPITRPDPLQIVAAGLVKDVQPAAKLGQPGESGQHRLVDGPGAPAAAKNQQLRFAAWHRRTVFHPLAQGIAGENRAPAMKGAIGFGERKADPVHPASQEAVGQSRAGILLMDQAGIPLQAGGRQKRGRCIPADAHHHLGTEPLEDPLGLAQAPDELRRQGRLSPETLADEAGDFDGRQRQLKLRQDPRLNAPLGADKQHLGARVPSP